MCYHKGMAIKIVVDTSVFISALIGPTGPSRELIRRCLKCEYQPLMGNALFCEYESVIKRDEVIGNAQIIATNNVRDFQNPELLFPNLSILKPEEIIRS
jgi:predicted nucleic acid-binding protein